MRATAFLSIAAAVLPLVSALPTTPEHIAPAARNPEIDYGPLGKRSGPQVVRDAPEARHAEIDYGRLGKRGDGQVIRDAPEARHAEIDYGPLGKKN